MSREPGWRQLRRSLLNDAHGFSVESVRSLDQLQQACRLLYRAYRARGYCDPNPNELHFSPYMLEPHARTFVLRECEQVRGTISIFPDGGRGVPLQSLYPAEIAQLRAPGIPLAEVGCLATDAEGLSAAGATADYSSRMLPVVLLFKIVVNFAAWRHIRQLLVAVHPRHKRFYEVLGFRQLAEVRSYQAVRGNPAVPMTLDLEEAARTISPTLRRVFLEDCFTEVHFESEEHQLQATLFHLAGDMFDAHASMPHHSLM